MLSRVSIMLLVKGYYTMAVNSVIIIKLLSKMTKIKSAIYNYNNRSFVFVNKNYKTTVYMLMMNNTLYCCVNNNIN